MSFVPKVETIEEFLARGGQITKCPDSRHVEEWHKRNLEAAVVKLNSEGWSRRAIAKHVGAKVADVNAILRTQAPLRQGE